VHARDLKRKQVKARVAEWRARLKSSNGPSSPARDLYQGEHWSIVREIASISRGEVLIASAGYGLIGLDTKIKSYSASFASRDEDSVIPDSQRDDWGSYASEWWAEQTRQRKRRKGEHTSLADAVRACPSRPLIVAVSTPYLFAIADDLREAVKALKGPRLLTILRPANAQVPEGLKDYTVNFDGRLAAILGGTLGSLNARVTLSLVEEVEGPLVRKSVQDWIDQQMASATPLEVPKRDRLSDEQIRAWIHRQLKAHGSSSHTRMLREFRDSDQACEQKRFRQLFKETVESSNGLFS
jgi:hypothetical protein